MCHIIIFDFYDAAFKRIFDKKCSLIRLFVRLAGWLAFKRNFYITHRAIDLLAGRIV
jgi:hypothetical protein